MLLTSPNTDDGGVIIELRGPSLTSVIASDTSKLFYSRVASDSVARVMVLGNLTSGPMFTFKVADGKALSAYSVTVQAVATRNNVMRGDLSAYVTTVTAAPAP